MARSILRCSSRPIRPRNPDYRPRAQAIAAMALGPHRAGVRRFSGPGNAYWLRRSACSDGHVCHRPASQGSSEVLVLAYDSAITRLSPRDLMRKPEHGSGRRAGMLVTPLMGGCCVAVER